MKTTASEPSAFSHVHRLIINDQYLTYLLLHLYTHINELYLSQVTIAFHEYLEFLHSSPHLRRVNVSAINLICLFLHQWPHIVNLKIENDFASRFHVLCSNDIDALCHSFPHIERLDIHLSSVTDLSQLINRMKMRLTDIVIRQLRKVNNEQFITREWVERNTELQNFHYRCSYWNCLVVALISLSQGHFTY
jgi:hypothetical protein